MEAVCCRVIGRISRPPLHHGGSVQGWRPGRAAMARDGYPLGAARRDSPDGPIDADRWIDHRPACQWCSRGTVGTVGPASNVAATWAGLAKVAGFYPAPLRG